MLVDALAMISAALRTIASYLETQKERDAEKAVETAIRMLNRHAQDLQTFLDAHKKRAT